VRVLSVVDRSGIERTGAGAHPGSIHLAEEATRSIGEREEEASERGVEEAVESLVAEGIEAEGEVREGDPHDEIVREGADCSLLLSSASSRYAFRDRDQPGTLLIHLMRERLLPVLLAGSVTEPVGTVVVGCDGGERSIRAVGAMARLGLWKGERILLAASDDLPEGRERKIAAAREILAEGAYPRVEEHPLSPPKRSSFPSLCAREGAQAAVLGGWGEHRWDDLLGLSLTDVMLREGRLHLFLWV
jgi:nucleotide-binding universal stress UspA family protein